MSTQNTPPSPIEKRRKLGFLLVVIGAFLCVFGFVITLVLLEQGVDFNMALYGATGAGGAMLLGGLVAVLG